MPSAPDPSVRRRVVTPERLEALRRAYGSAPFVAELGMRLVSAGEGVCVSALELAPRHLQQDGFVHAGVQMTLADHTAGVAAATIARSLYKVLTTELSIHLLRPARGERLECVARVLRSGRLLTVVESEVYCESGAARTFVSKATATIANVPDNRNDTGEPVS